MSMALTGFRFQLQKGVRSIFCPASAAMNMASHVTDKEKGMVRQALHERKPGWGLPGAFYSDPTLHNCDLQGLWTKKWLFAGHDCELQRRGDWITLQVGKFPILVVRGMDDQIRAFHNSCRHRGYPLCEGDKGRVTKRLKCPYHQWTYDLDGQLAFAKDLSKSDGFDKEQFSLKPVALESAGGYIFISVAEKPPDFKPLGDMLESYLAPFDLRTAKVAHKSRIVEKGNWKMVWENNRECYHCKGSHPELAITFPDGPWWNGRVGTPKQRQMVADLKASCEALGLPSQFVAADDAEWRLTRLPLNKGARSFTMTGEPAVHKKRLGRMPEEESCGAVMLYNYPNTWNHFMADHAVSFRMLPISPTETELVTTWLVPGDAEEGVDYDVDILTEVWKQTNAQDRELVERNQVGVTSPAFEPGPYHPLHEEGVSEFVDWYQMHMLKYLGTEQALEENDLVLPSVTSIEQFNKKVFLTTR